ncbi:hypothetical protein Hanom_Chr04g00280901 [Helianthus anomalus]
MDGVNQPDENGKISNLWTKVAKLTKPQGRKWHFTPLKYLNMWLVRRTEKIPNKGAFSFSCLAAAGTLSALTAGGLGCWGGAPALCIPCDSHRINGARAPV